MYLRRIRGVAELTMRSTFRRKPHRAEQSRRFALSRMPGPPFVRRRRRGSRFVESHRSSSRSRARRVFVQQCSQTISQSGVAFPASRHFVYAACRVSVDDSTEFSSVADLPASFVPVFSNLWYKVCAAAVNFPGTHIKCLKYSARYRILRQCLPRSFRRRARVSIAFGDAASSERRLFPGIRAGMAFTG